MQQFISTDKSGDCEGVMRVGSVLILEPEDDGMASEGIDRNTILLYY